MTPALRIRLGRPNRSGRPERQLPARRHHPGERAQERALAVALDSGESHDLARLDIEGDVVEAAAAERLRAEQRRHRLAGGALCGEDLVDRAADDQPQDLALGDAVGVEGAASLAVAEHGDPIGDLLDLGKAVGDVDDGGALVAYRADVREQAVALRVGERFGRLVENKHSGVEGERLGDFDELAVGGAEVADALRRVDVGADAASCSRVQASALDIRGRSGAGMAKTMFSTTVRSSRIERCW